MNFKPPQNSRKSAFIPNPFGTKTNCALPAYGSKHLQFNVTFGSVVSFSA